MKNYWLENRKNKSNFRFLAEAREIEKHWERTGLLKGLEGRIVRPCTAILLESQRLCNEKQ
jgi:hypothetical protein